MDNLATSAAQQKLFYFLKIGSDSMYLIFYKCIKLQ